MALIGPAHGSTVKKDVNGFSISPSPTVGAIHRRKDYLIEFQCSQSFTSTPKPQVQPEPISATQHHPSEPIPVVVFN